MSSANSTPDPQPNTSAQIPTLLTTSFRAITDVFSSDIVALSAHGSVTTTNTTPAEGLREYFITRDQQTNHGLTVEYTQQAGADGPHNPLSNDIRQQIIGEIETVLGTEDTPVVPDLTVTSCTVRVTDERLQAVTPARTPEFDLRFVADPAEEPIRGRTRRVNAERGLYRHLGFDIQHLNLRSVVETATKYHEQADGRYFSWQGPSDIRPRAPTRLTTRVNNHVLPDEYGALKRYTVAADEALEFTGTVDASETTHQFGEAGDTQSPDEHEPDQEASQ